MPDETTPSPEGGIFSNKKNLIIILAVAAAAVSGLIIWLISRPEPGPPAFPTETPGGSLPPGQAVELKTYDNKKYGYSLKYPKNWYVDSGLAEKELSDNVGGELIISSQENPLALLESGKAPADLATLSLTVYQVSSQTTTDQFIKDRKYATALAQTPVKYGNLSGKQLTYSFFNENKKEVINIVTILKQNTIMYVFSWNSFGANEKESPAQTNAVHARILDSFKIN
jgi:hypothetical protein